MPPPNVLWPEAYCFSPVRPCMRPKTLLTRYLAEYLTHFHQTYINDALWDRDVCFTIWGQKVKSQGHDGIKYMLEPSLYRRKHIIQYSTSRVELDFLVQNWRLLFQLIAAFCHGERSAYHRGPVLEYRTRN